MVPAGLEPAKHIADDLESPSFDQLGYDTIFRILGLYFYINSHSFNMFKNQFFNIIVYI